MTQVSLSFLYGVLRSTVAVYIALVALHFVLEVFFAHRAYRRSKQGFPDPARLPSVDVVVPCYNEDAGHLTACFDAQVLLIDHDVDLIAAICSQTLVMDFGRRLALGPTRAVLDDAEVRRAYLGT